jgi:hypothetical protein
MKMMMVMTERSEVDERNETMNKKIMNSYCCCFLKAMAQNCKKLKRKTRAFSLLLCERRKSSTTSLFFMLQSQLEPAQNYSLRDVGLEYTVPLG